MSRIDAKSPQHCGKKKLLNISNLQKKVVYSFTSFFSSILLLILVVWFILHPEKPQFSLKEADVYQLVVSGTHLLNSSIQLTLVSRNPNSKVGNYYDQIRIYASYKGQQITSPSSLAPFYQDRKDTNLVSAVLAASCLPVAPSFNYDLGRDEMLRGRLVLNLKANGLLRWKLGTWVSATYRFNINCVAVMLFGPSSAPAPPLTSNKQPGTQCSTTI